MTEEDYIGTAAFTESEESSRAVFCTVEVTVGIDYFLAFEDNFLRLSDGCALIYFIEITVAKDGKACAVIFVIHYPVKVGESVTEEENDLGILMHKEGAMHILGVAVGIREYKTFHRTPLLFQVLFTHCFFWNSI